MDGEHPRRENDRLIGRGREPATTPPVPDGTADPLLPGEDPANRDADNAELWTSIYTELSDFATQLGIAQLQRRFQRRLRFWSTRPVH